MEKLELQLSISHYIFFISLLHLWHVQDDLARTLDVNSDSNDFLIENKFFKTRVNESDRPFLFRQSTSSTASSFNIS